MSAVGLSRDYAGGTRGVSGRSKTLSYRAQIFQIVAENDANLGASLLVIEAKFGINAEGISQISGILN